MLAKLTKTGGFLLLFVLALSLPALSQKKVSGKVTGPDAKPVASATVSVKGTNIGTTTGADGAYSITVPDNANTLVFSFIGYEIEEYRLDGNTNLSALDVVMKSATTNLNEVVVVGYSAQRKKDITGAVTVVNVADMKSQPAGDITSQLQGRASGVNVIQNNTPGQSSTVRIRGLGSFSNNSPLYVVDGIQTFSINGLNPDDIETMQVLKDAASASVYGSQASNGVIIVTTKRGNKKRGVSVAYDMYYGTQNPGKGLDLLNAQEAADLTFLTLKNSGSPTTGTIYGNGATPVLPDYIYATGIAAGTVLNTGNPAVDPAKYNVDYSRLGDAGYSPYIIVPSSKGGTNWYKEMTQNAPIQNHTLGLSSSTDKSRLYFSLNYFNQDAVTRFNFYKRFSVRLNSEFNLFDHVKIGENINALYNTANNSLNGTNVENSVFAESYRMMAIVPVYTIRPGDYAGTLGNYGNAYNPVAYLGRGKDDRSNTLAVFGNIYAEVEVAKDFTARTSFGGSIISNTQFTYPWIQYENQENNPNTTYFESATQANGWTWTNQLGYKHRFDKHNISALAVYEARLYGGRSQNGRAIGFYAYNYLPFINLNNGASQNTNGSGKFAQTAYTSVLGQINYAYNDRYLLSAVLRHDGTSKAQGDNRYGNFPAFSLGWRISEEDFMKSTKWVNDLKIRGSWGKMGNEVAIPSSNSFTTFGSDRGSSWYDMLGGQTKADEGFYLSFVGNAGVTWETSVNTNIGFDATLFNNKTQIVFDWYVKKTEGLLFNPSLPAISGGAAANNPAFYNVGNMENHGIDLMISQKILATNDISLDADLTFTTYKNKITRVSDGADFFPYNSPINERNRIGGDATRNQVGHSLNAFYGYQVVGLFQSASDVTNSPTQNGAAPGRFKYADVNGPDGKPDGAITDLDRTFIGNPNPDFNAGLNLDLKYKNFDLVTFFYASVGKESFNYVRWWTDFSTAPGGRSKAALYDSWLPDGSRPNAKTPIQESSSSFSTNTAVNSYYIENSSFLRMRSLQIGYTLPLSIAGKIKATKARIYVQGTNLFTVTKYTGLDPDILSNDDRAAGIDAGVYPTVKQFIVGVSLNF